MSAKRGDKHGSSDGAKRDGSGKARGDKPPRTSSSEIRQQAPRPKPGKGKGDKGG